MEGIIGWGAAAPGCGIGADAPPGIGMGIGTAAGSPGPEGIAGATGAEGAAGICWTAGCGVKAKGSRSGCPVGRVRRGTLGSAKSRLRFSSASMASYCDRGESFI